MGRRFHNGHADKSLHSIDSPIFFFADEIHRLAGGANEDPSLLAGY
ncbi:hypothetical protein [Sphingomonas sp. PP-F2F-A104-K0414]|nr:hypothetical protein [Sphingomonas sp. PP-F2F-A104-K0414]